jgi:hypothetical protein
MLHNQIKDLLKVYEYTKNSKLGVSFLLIGEKNTKVVVTLKTRWGENYLLSDHMKQRNEAHCCAHY